MSISRFNKGFTIIEVMIVLAIAGLILLIVFIAVPALQRNSRNLQRRADATSLFNLANEYANNNQNDFPTGLCTLGPGSPIILGDSSPGFTPVQSNLGFYRYTPASGTVSGNTCSAVTFGSTIQGAVHYLQGSQLFSGTDHVLIDVGATCDGASYSGQNTSTPHVTTQVGSVGQVAVVYLIELGNNAFAVHCLSN